MHRVNAALKRTQNKPKRFKQLNLNATAAHEQTLTCEEGNKGECVISQGIWASQKLSGGSILDLSKLQDPRTLGYLLIFGLYSKPIAYC